MIRFKIISFLLLISCKALAQQETAPKNSFVLEANMHIGTIMHNSGIVPANKTPFLAEINASFQTHGREDWHYIFKFPRVGCDLVFGYLGNSKELGNVAGLVPNITFNSINQKWYIPRISLGLGLAYFNKTYDEISNPANFYIGSHVTAMGTASVQIESQLNSKFNLVSGIKVVHCSNGHYQVPNLGLNTLSFFVGLKLNPTGRPNECVYRKVEVPPSKLKLNFRAGIGRHEFARTFGPAGTPKYAIYIADIFVSRRFGKVSNVHTGLELKYYTSYYDFIVTNDFLPGNPKLNSVVVTTFIAHELMIKRFGIVTQLGYNVYNKFYMEYIKMWKSEQGLSSQLKRRISSRLGIQYYLFAPKYCTNHNVFIGAYIKANLGMADFACIQTGFVF